MNTQNYAAMRCKGRDGWILVTLPPPLSRSQQSLAALRGPENPWFCGLLGPKLLTAVPAYLTKSSLFAGISPELLTTAIWYGFLSHCF
jgi:hypothetical protein